MNCKQITRLMSDKIDLLLPRKVEKQFDIHTRECSLCDTDMKALLSAKQMLKALYPDMSAPLGLRSAVMREIASQRGIGAVYSFHSLVGRLHKPFAAVALSAAILLGLFALDRNLSGLRELPEEVQQAYGNGTKIQETQETAIDDSSNGSALAQTDQSEPSAEPKITDEPPVTYVAEEVTTVQEMPVNEEPPLIDATFLSVPEEPRSPIVVEKTVAEIQPSASHNGSVKITEPVLTPVSLNAEYSEPIIFSEADIPDPFVFLRRKRVIEVTTIKITVPRIDKALPLLEDRAELFGFKPDMTNTQLKENGTITVMQSFIVPMGMAHILTNQLFILGSVTSREKSSLDVTSDYSRMLDEHSLLLEEVVKSGTGVRHLKELVEQLMFFDKRSQPGVENVVIWLEDGVDF